MAIIFIATVTRTRPFFYNHDDTFDSENIKAKIGDYVERYLAKHRTSTEDLDSNLTTDDDRWFNHR